MSISSGLPPGVFVTRLERAMGGFPPVCEDCEYEVCPLGWRFEFCPRIEIIEKCKECGKRIGLVPALVEHKVYGYVTIYLCSLGCQRKMQQKVSNEIKKRYPFQKRWCEQCDKTN